MKWFPSWVMLLAMGCYEEISPPCRWQTSYPKYKKETIVLHNDPCFHYLSGICRCRRSHVLLQGSLTTLASAYPAKLCKDITLSCTQGLSTDEGTWGFEADVGGPELDDETPEDALFAHIRPGSKHYIVSLSESLH